MVSSPGLHSPITSEMQDIVGVSLSVGVSAVQEVNQAVQKVLDRAPSKMRTKLSHQKITLQLDSMMFSMVYTPSMT